MDEDIKSYADTLYENARMESGKTLREARKNVLREKAARSLGYVPFSGPDIQALMGLFDAHIERCMTARFESYEQAYRETGRVPSEQDFTDILNECKAVQVLEIGHSTTAIRQFISSHGPVGVPMEHIESQVEHSSARGHDRVIQRWKIWKAKTQLKPSAAVTDNREKPRDVLLPTYNRAEFDQDLAILASKSTLASPLAVIFMDLDKFKSINGGPGGHEAGDRALRVFAEVLLKVSSGKGSTYRYGGDELCVLLPNHGLDEALAVAERIRREVQAIRTDELPNGLSTSVGVACFPGSTADSTKLVSLADRAMYDSKAAGGNRVSKANIPKE